MNATGWTRVSETPPYTRLCIFQCLMGGTTWKTFSNGRFALRRRIMPVRISNRVAGEAGEEAAAPSPLAPVGGRMCMRRNYRAGVVRSHYSSIQLTIVMRRDASSQQNFYNIKVVFCCLLTSLSIDTLPSLSRNPTIFLFL